MFGAWTSKLLFLETLKHWWQHLVLEEVLLWSNFHLLYKGQTLPCGKNLCPGHAKACSELGVPHQRSLLHGQTSWQKRSLHLSATYELGRKNVLVDQVRSRIMEEAVLTELHFATWIKEDCELSPFSGSSFMYQYSYLQNTDIAPVELGLLSNGVQLNWCNEQWASGRAPWLQLTYRKDSFCSVHSICKCSSRKYGFPDI